MNNQLRQIRDIQAQAERILSRRVPLLEVKEFARYSRELKRFLESNISDELVLKLVHEIPDLEAALRRKNVSSSVLDGGLALVIGVLPFTSRERRKVDRVKPVVREMQGKYSSIEFVLKNQGGT